MHDFTENEKQITLQYYANGTKSFTLPVYGGLRDYYASKARRTLCIGSCLDKQELRYITDEKQLPLLNQLVSSIKSETEDPQQQARIAVSLVQRVPYDIEAYNLRDAKNRYPYEVLYDQLGLCGEKSRLLAYLLKELGFGVGIFLFDEHQAVAIKCTNHTFQKTSYCFIETTGPAIITDSEASYANVRLSNYSFVFVSDGISFNANEDFDDLQKYRILDGKLRDQATVTATEYKQLIALTKKYGLEQKTCPQEALLCNGRCVRPCAGFSCTENGPTCSS